MSGTGHKVSNEYSRQRLLEFVQGLDLSGRPWVFRWSRENPNSWPMKKTWRKWMSETADWMARHGATMPLVLKNGQPHGQRPFNADDAHELFVRTYLGVDANGERYKTASGDKGQMLLMMDKHLAWASERGLFLTVPEDGEFMQCKQAQEA